MKDSLFAGGGTYCNWVSEPLTAETFAEGLRRYRERENRYEPPTYLVSPAQWTRLQAVRREFPKATNEQCLMAAYASDDNAGAIAAFVEFFGR